MHLRIPGLRAVELDPSSFEMANDRGVGHRGASKGGIPAGQSLHRDLQHAGLGFAGFRDFHLQQSVVKVGLELLGIHVVGQGEAADEIAIAALDPVEAQSMLLVFLVSFPLKG